MNNGDDSQLRTKKQPSPVEESLTDATAPSPPEEATDATVQLTMTDLEPVIERLKAGAVSDLEPLIQRQQQVAGAPPAAAMDSPLMFGMPQDPTLVGEDSPIPGEYINSTLQLSDTDLELVESSHRQRSPSRSSVLTTNDLAAETSVDGTAADSLDSDGQPSQSGAALAAGLGQQTVAIPGAALGEPSAAPMGASAEFDWGTEAAFYLREAQATVRQQPERSAWMWLQAARSAELGAGDPQKIDEWLEAALRHAPDNPQLLPQVRRARFRQRHYQQAIALTIGLSQLGGANVARAAGLLEAAALKRFVDDDAEGAIELMAQALALHPGYETGLAYCAVMQLEAGRHAAAAESFEQLAELVTLSPERACCLYQAATLREKRLDQLESAAHALGRAVELDPRCLPALVASCELHQRMQIWPYLSRDLQAIASLELSPASKARYLLRSGALHLYRTGDLEAAAHSFSQAADFSLEDPSPLTRLVWTLEQAGLREQQLGALQRLLALTNDPLGRATLCARIGWLMRFSDDQEQAIAVYRSALEHQPGFLPALQVLGTLFQQRQEPARLLEILLPETEGAGTLEHRAMRWFEAAELLAGPLARASEAIAAYRRALELCPSFLLAFWRLRDLLARERQHSALAGLLASQIDAAADEGMQHYLLIELAGLQATALQAGSQAISTLERAKQIPVNRIAAMKLIDLYHSGGHFAELVDQLLTVAESTQDAAESSWRRIQAAAILDQQLHEHERALQLYHQVISEHPNCVGAIRPAGRLYHRLGRWRELIELHQHEIEVEEDLIRQAQLWCRIARIYDEDLGQQADAIAAYHRALEIDPGSAAALAALESLLHSGRRFSELVQVLQGFAKKRTDPLAAADLLCRAADLADTALGDAPAAAELYQEALQVSPRFPSALVGLLTVQVGQGQSEAAVGTLEGLLDETTCPLERRLLLLQLARLKEFGLGQLPAAELFDGATEQGEPDVTIRFERVRALRLTQDPQLTAALLDFGGRSGEPSLAVSHLLECAHRQELNGNPQEHLAAGRAAHARDPADLAAIWSLQRGFEAAGMWRELAEVFEEEARREPDPAIALPLFTEAATACFLAEQPQKASRLAIESLTLDAWHLPSLRLMAVLAARDQQWRELASLLDRLAEASVDQENRRQASLLAADLWSYRVGDLQAGLSSLQRLLEDEPAQAAAFARAEQLLTRIGDFQRLAQLLARRIDSCLDPAEQSGLIRQQIVLLRDRVGDRPQAIVALHRLLELAPDDLSALAELADLLDAEQRWADATQTLNELIARTPKLEVRQKGRLQLARIQLSQLHLPEQARAVLDQALEEAPENIQVKKLLAEVQMASGRWDDAQRLLDEVTAENKPELQIWAMSQMAEVARVGLRDKTLQRQYELETLVLAADYPEMLTPLIAGYRQRQDLPRFVALSEEIISQTLDQPAASRLRLAVAKVLFQDLKQSQRALDCLGRISADQPEAGEARLLLPQVQEQRGEVETAAAGYRELIAEDLCCAEAYRGLHRLMAVLGRPSVAAAAAAMLELLGLADHQELAQVAATQQGGFPPGTLDLAALPIDPELVKVRQILSLAQPYLGSVYPQPFDPPLKVSHPVAIAAKRLAGCLGLNLVKVTIGGEAPATTGVGEPVPLQIATHIAGQPESAEFRFWVGRALAGAATTYTLIEQLSNFELGQLVEAVVVQRPIDPAVNQLRKQILRALPRKVRKQIEQLQSAQVTSAIWSGYREAMRRRTDQIGMLLAGGPKVAITELTRYEKALPPVDWARSSRIRELILYIFSDEYDQHFRSVWRAG